MKKYSDNFNTIFTFFLKSYRSGILTFSGVDVPVHYDINGPEGKFTFRKFENGDYVKDIITSCHPNIIKGVIIAKKSWGLHIKLWSEGIADWCFTEEEILKQFSDKGILIPEPLLNDFKNHVNKAKQKRYE